MLKKIDVGQLRLGMHLHKLEASWMAHSLWNSKFVIDNTADLRRVQSSGVAECWIDVSLGQDVAQAAEPAEPPAAMAVAAAAAPAVNLMAAGAAARSATAPRSLAEELKQAAAICQRGREAVSAMFNEARMGRTVDAERYLPLVDEIAGSVLRNPGALVSLARLKTRDDYSYMHSVAVCALMVALARQRGLDDEACRQAGTAGLLHDIGKVLVPLGVLNKPGKLTDLEYAVVRRHPEQGHALLLGGDASGATLDVVLHHHERMDGTGYPHRLAGEQISLFARMGAICDVYDAITSNRPYKMGWDPAESVARMASWKGHFDTLLFGSFVQSLGIYPTGSLVRLESGKLAVVVEQNPQQLVSPKVKVFFSTRSQLPITPELLDLSRKGCHDRIVGRADRSDGNFKHLDELWADPEVLRRLRAG